MMIKFTIPLKPKTPDFPAGYRLPGLNKVVSANRTHWSAGAKLKKETQEYISWFIPPMLRGLKLSGVQVRIDWYEFDKRRDYDNITSAQKFILDAMVDCGVLAGDGQRHVLKITHNVEIDRENPRVSVTIRKDGEHADNL